MPGTEVAPSVRSVGRRCAFKSSSEVRFSVSSTSRSVHVRFVALGTMVEAESVSTSGLKSGCSPTSNDTGAAGSWRRIFEMDDFPVDSVREGRDGNLDGP